MSRLIRPSLAALALILIVPTINAASLFLGIKAGGNYAIQWGPDAHSDAGFTPGILGGLQIPIWFNDNIALTPEVMFSGKYIKWDTTLSDVAAESTIVSVRRYINYMEIPLVIQYMFGKKGPLIPYVGLAPVVSTLLSAKQVINQKTVTKTRDLAERMETVDFAVAVSAGAHLPVAKGGLLSVDLRYTFGVLNIEKDLILRNSCISGSLGYAFKIEKQKEEW